MTIAEMHNLYKLLMNKADTLNYPNFEPEEIDVFLNNEMFKMIEQRAYGNNFKHLGVEETQKRTDDLKNITVNYIGTVLAQTVNNKPNGYFVNLPSDYRHALQEDCEIWYTDCTGTGYTATQALIAAALEAGEPIPDYTITPVKVVPIIPISHDRYNKVIRDPFNKPYDELVNRLPYQKVNGIDSLELLTDGTFSIINYNLRYLRTPLSVRYGTAYATPTTDVNCELSEHIHREIVEATVRSTLENIESQRYNTQNQVIRETE